MATTTKLAKVLTSVTPELRSGSGSRSSSNPFGALKGLSSSYSSTAVATNTESDVMPSRYMGLDIFGVKDYEDYRRSLYGEITHKAVLVDAVGTVLVPSQPTAEIYRKIGEKYGVQYSEDEILYRYRIAYGQPWGKSRLRYVNDGRPFWQFIVSYSTGCSDPQYFEELYN
ncbi:hypothetical protein L6164_009316 [Bauhinia variegata]|uniref:Uncharacterized protein n=1 Tax=Bauhinia variegata TaxID=167791 RepID=A0ACB9PJH0_BAUVA|nr:hypothetical protein L6164_009316 [Bauhinia variegata]